MTDEMPAMRHAKRTGDRPLLIDTVELLNEAPQTIEPMARQIDVLMDKNQEIGSRIRQRTSISRRCAHLVPKHRQRNRSTCNIRRTLEVAWQHVGVIRNRVNMKTRHVHSHPAPGANARRSTQRLP